jgi:hypothetical protein
MNPQNKIIPLSSWLTLADNAYNSSKYLSLNPQFGIAVFIYLLHWSIELYLKAFLLNCDVQVIDHKLASLYNKCVKYDGSFNSFVYRGREQKYWIKWLDIAGAKDGGVRYLHKDRTSYVFPGDINEAFQNLISYIKSKVNMNKDITRYCF